MTKKVAVIGGGIVGCITSFFLIKKGYEVTLIDQSAIGQEASWAGAGILSPLLPWNYQDSVIIFVLEVLIFIILFLKL